MTEKVFLNQSAIVTGAGVGIGYEVARQLLEEHRGAVRAMAEELLLVESLDADGIKAIMASSSAA